MQMDSGLDTGDMLYKAECDISKDETSKSLHDKLCQIGPDALLKTLTLLTEQKLTPEKQNDAEHTYAGKINKSQANIGWQKSAIEIDRCIRAFNPWPGAHSSFSGELVKVWQAECLESSAPSKAKPGTIIAIDKTGLDVATGDGVLRLQSLQLSGGKVLSVSQVLNANKPGFDVGKVFWIEWLGFAVYNLTPFKHEYTQSISSCDAACVQLSSGMYGSVPDQRDKRTTKSQLERRRV